MPFGLLRQIVRPGRAISRLAPGAKEVDGKVDSDLSNRASLHFLEIIDQFYFVPGVRYYRSGDRAMRGR
jgi:hypothetical protein